MGNCICSNVSNKFINSNIIDKQYNIEIGIYTNSLEKTNSPEKSNTLINQGICINNQIYKIKFGIMHKYDTKIVELYFENCIKLIFIKDNKKIKMIFTFGDKKIEKYIEPNIIKQYKKINNNSEYIDLIYELL